MTRRSTLDDKDSQRPGEAGEDSIRLALERARSHAQLALSEAVAAARALLDAASLGVTGAPADRSPIFSDLAETLDLFSANLASASTSPSLQALQDALDDQIARWEKLSHGDPNARGVLRAFLALREILWESGLRPRPENEPRRSHTAKPRRSTSMPIGSARDSERHIGFSA